MKCKKVSNYIILYDHVLGRGGFSKVFMGIDTRKKIRVAVKVIDTNQNSLQYVLEEIKNLQIVEHENVLGCKDVFKENNKIYIFLELCVMDLFVYLRKKRIEKSFYPSLFEQKKIDDIKKSPFLCEEEIQWWMKQLKNGIVSLREKKIVHRDIKPENLLLMKISEKETLDFKNFIIKISDLGFSKKLKDNILTSTACGTLTYMSPERVSLQQYGANSDLWSVGMILMELIRGTRLFSLKKNISKKERLNQMSILLKKFSPKKILEKYKISDELFDLAHKLLEIKVEDRITMDEFANHPFFKLEINSSPLIIQDNPQPFTKKEKIVDNISEELDETDSFLEEYDDLKDKKDKKTENDTEIENMIPETVYCAQKVENFDQGMVLFQQIEKLLYRAKEKKLKIQIENPGLLSLSVANLDISFLGVQNVFYVKIQFKEGSGLKCDVENQDLKRNEEGYYLVEETVKFKLLVPVDYKTEYLIVKLKPKKKSGVVQKFIKKNYIKFCLVLKQVFSAEVVMEERF